MKGIKRLRDATTYSAFTGLYRELQQTLEESPVSQEDILVMFWADKLIIFDADGTLTTYRQHACHDAPLTLLQNVEDRLNQLSAAGIVLAIASNQRVGEWGGRLYTDAIIRDRFDELARLLPIPRDLMRSSHTDPEVRRKPKPTMLLELLSITGFDAQEARSVGDRDSDRLAAEAAGIAFTWAWDFFDWPNGKDDREIDWEARESIWRIPLPTNVNLAG